MAGKNKTNHFAWRLAIGIIAAVLLLSGGLIASAQGGYPERQDFYVNDYAGVMTVESVAQITALLTDLEQQHGIESTVLTVDSIHDYGTSDTTIESFATNLFNTWGIGDATLNNGVLILVAVADREVRIEVGEGYGDTMNDPMAYVINEFMLSSFRRGDYSMGIYQGTRAVIQSLTGVWPEDLNPAPSTPPTSTYTDSSSEKGRSLWTYILGIGGGAGALGAGAYGVQTFSRYRKRSCPNCKTMLVRLDEVSDDVYLSDGQKLEEVLASIDYDVWRCPNCNYHTLLGYPRLMSGLRNCSSCGFRTLHVSSRTIDPPTYSSTGMREITEKCQNCSHDRSHTVIIPRLTRSTSSGGSHSSRSSGGGRSGGGGRSSGGGASGKW
ncbi:MAG: TPM domain-containing protein [Chloroflexi bacterium]|nr:TPM domain-containing protein [Chloroflexota bacterium]